MSEARVDHATPLNTIVVGYDASAEAERALMRAAEMARAFNARLVVVNIAVPMHGPDLVFAAERVGVFPLLAATSMPLAPTAALDPMQPRPEDLSAEYLERAQMLIDPMDVEAEYVIDVGDPAQQLLDVAAHLGADLIVVGSRDRGFLERLLGHPVDEDLARRSENDVLLVR
jgi:nucleotide-binding universal stress UspA family protein